MERAVGLERTYRLGEFKSLKVSDHIGGIPEEFATNEGFISDLKALQIVSAEKLYYQYAQLSDTLPDLEGNQEKVDYLEKLENDLYARLSGYLTGDNGEEETK